MTNQKLSSTLVIGWVAVPALAIFLGAGAARAQNNTAHYIFLVAAGFLCESGDSSACPAAVKSADGASYELSGAGTFAPQSKSAMAAGTYALKSSSGDVLETGVWVASEFVSFDLYGIAPGALMGGGRALGPPPVGPKRFPVFSGSTAAGGRAVLRIRLLPVLGLAKNATLQVNCALGKVPPEHQVEGIRLAFEGGGVEFDEEISGRAMFLMIRPGASTSAKTSTPEADTKPAPTGVQQ